MRERYRVNFPNHMTECEFNYYRLLRLLPGWESINAISLSEASDVDDVSWSYLINDLQSLRIQLTDVAKYTTTVHITVVSELQNCISLFKYSKGKMKNRAELCKKQTSSARQKAPQKQRFHPQAVDRKNIGANHLAMTVRLYHDASLAEVVGSEVTGYQKHRYLLPRYSYPNSAMHQRDEKSQLNQFLGEVLSLCLAEGRVEKTLQFVRN